MRSLSLRSRLLLWASGATAVTLLLVIVLADHSFRGNIRDQLIESLTFARQVAGSVRQGQIDAHISESAATALDARLRAAVATGDPATISQTLEEVVPSASAGWAAVLGTDGSLLAATAGAPGPQLADAGGLINEALYTDTGDLWLDGQQLMDVAASAILFGAEPLAVLVTGNPVDAQRVAELEAGVGRTVAIVAGGRATVAQGAERLPAGGFRDLEAWHPSTDDAVELLTLGGERFYAAATPLVSREGTARGTIVLLGSFDEALGPSDTLRVALLVIFVFGLLLTFGVSSVFSRTVTVPVGRLLRETERLGHGDLEHRIVPVREDEIGRLAEAFEDMRVSLKGARADLIRAERLSAIGKAASAVAHDFTQPLSTIAGAVGLLRMESDPEMRERCFSAIESELDRLQRMKQEIVEFARGESTLDEGEVRIDSFLENTVSALRGQLAERSIALSIEHGYSGEWYIDSYRLERVLENLVRNAAVALSKDGHVTIRSTMASDRLRIEVEDDGPGIPAHLVDEIFEPFVSFGKKEGTGLGLAIARNVVAQHGGTIDVESRPGRTCFTIVLPRREAPAGTTAPAAPARQAS